MQATSEMRFEENKSAFAGLDNGLNQRHEMTAPEQRKAMEAMRPSDNSQQLIHKGTLPDLKIECDVVKINENKTHIECQVEQQHRPFNMIQLKEALKENGGGKAGEAPHSSSGSQNLLENSHRTYPQPGTEYLYPGK